MSFASSVIQYATIITWILSIIALLALAAYAAICAILKLQRKWTQSFRDITHTAYILRAIRAYEKSGHKMPEALVLKTPKEIILGRASRLVAFAREHQLILSIQPVSTEPLRMGGHYPRIEVRAQRIDGKYPALEAADGGANG